jgi:hypothetical protein
VASLFVVQLHFSGAIEIVVRLHFCKKKKNSDNLKEAAFVNKKKVLDFSLIGDEFPPAHDRSPHLPLRWPLRVETRLVLQLQRRSDSSIESVGKKVVVALWMDWISSIERPAVLKDSSITPATSLKITS